MKLFLFSIVAVVALWALMTGEAHGDTQVYQDTVRLDVGESRTFTFEAPETIDFLVGMVNWNKNGHFDPDDNVKVVVETPEFAIIFDDPYLQSTQVFIVTGPQPAGDYKVTVTNDGTERLPRVKIEAGIRW